MLNWFALANALIHPIKVTILEILAGSAVPLSATDIARVLRGTRPATNIAYHLRSLTDEGILEKVRIVEVRGSAAVYYKLAPGFVMEPARSTQ